MVNGHRQFFITLHNAQPKHKALVAQRISAQNHIVWYMVALEEYTGRETDSGDNHVSRTPYHIHLSFRTKHQLGAKLFRTRLVEWWSSVASGNNCDVFMQPGQGSFTDCANYITKEPLDGHKNLSQMDKEPIFYPTRDYVEPAGRTKVSSGDIIKLLDSGKTYKDILRIHPEWCLSNGARLKSFIKDYKPIALENQRKAYYANLKSGALF